MTSRLVIPIFLLFPIMLMHSLFVHCDRCILVFLLPFNLSAEWTTDLSPLADHFTQLVDISPLSQFTSHLFLGSILVLVLTLVLAAIGIAHFWQYSFEDKIRIRLLYGFFTAITAVTVFFIIVQPQHFDVLMRLLTLFACPLIAHVLTFTSSRLSNILFFVALALAVALTAFNLIGNV